LSYLQQLREALWNLRQLRCAVLLLLLLSGLQTASGGEDSDMEKGSTPPLPSSSEASGGRTTSPLRLLSSVRNFRQKLEQHGITANITFTNDWSLVRQFANTPATSFERYLLDGQITVRSGELLGWHGGQACVRVHHYFGENGSDRVGDAQGFSNIDDVPRTMLYELWYEQTLVHDRVRVKLGKIDANTEFAKVSSGSNFLNSSMGYSPTIMALPTYPEPRPSVNVFLQTKSGYSLGVGAYHAGLGAVMSLAEAGRTWEVGANELPGRAIVGLWQLNARISDFDGDLRPGTQGYYAVLEQLAWKGNQESDSKARDLSTFLQLGLASGEVSSFTHHVGGGVVLRGLLERTSRDEVGLGATWARFTQHPAAEYAYGSELDTEAYYKMNLRTWAALVVDVQWIRHPGGRYDCHDTIVMTPRLVAVF
jgi:porin